MGRAPIDAAPGRAAPGPIHRSLLGELRLEVPRGTVNRCCRLTIGQPQDASS